MYPTSSKCLIAIRLKRRQRGNSSWYIQSHLGLLFACDIQWLLLDILSTELLDANVPDPDLMIRDLVFAAIAYLVPAERAIPALQPRPRTFAPGHLGTLSSLFYCHLHVTGSPLKNILIFISLLPTLFTPIIVSFSLSLSHSRLMLRRNCEHSCRASRNTAGGCSSGWTRPRCEASGPSRKCRCSTSTRYGYVLDVSSDVLHVCV